MLHTLTAFIYQQRCAIWSLVVSVNATFLSLSFCPTVWAVSRSVIHGTGNLITVFTQEPSSGTYPGSLITVFVQEPSSGTYPGSLITVFTREPSSVIYLEASLQCSHKSLPLELTWKPHYSVHTRTFLWNLPGKSDSILIKNLCLCFPSQIIRLEFWVYCSLAPLALLAACIDCPRWKM